MHIVLQLSDSTALKSDTRLELIIFSDGASPVPVLSELPVLAQNSKICFKKDWKDRTCRAFYFSYVSSAWTYEAGDVFLGANWSTIKIT